ncbi:MAG: M20/M25/M40 family metallo-hydrolase [Bacteroidetes bacterium]|jgi:carboxypeptidase Q|nr:M20/M25/M40 family metallo-hydrolase [Bacteroidota bacterium]MBK8329934.1 M20/M25/M40 family metallo-hydrolase [Bacteroidota bacterium]MBK9483508.1 M20/M25/M40 family metallo-hydrolase [Bacteroidota bacterium]HQW47117.1 M20/M25/M40 family metallo-hydrolase [Chitinophagaceae bacterium]
MKKILYLFLALLAGQTVVAQNVKKDSATLKTISNYILSNYDCYNDLRDLCKQIGHRISGSPQAEQAVLWGKKVLEQTGCDKVYLQEVMVPHWVRGEEQGMIINKKGMRSSIEISSLGNAVGTGPQGIEAPLLIINNIEQLQRMRPEEVKGKIVFFNYHFNQTNINTFESYGPCVYYRWGAPSEAAKMGASAVVIRSVSSAFDDKPHTGSMSYNKKYPAIPSVAISNLAADKLAKEINTQGAMRMYIRTTCEMLPDVKSYNVIAEITGSEIPNEIICFGGHLDSWDIGEGAHDDGAGVVQSIDVIRTFMKLGIKPKRTIRAILFMNEENGLRGGQKYAEEAARNKENHILAIESDAGGATPHGFSMTMSREQKAKIKSWLPLLLPYGIYDFTRDGGGADIGPLQRKFGTPVMELLPDSQRYFDMHHSANDVFENVHRRELCLGSVAMTAMVYLVSMYGL